MKDVGITWDKDALEEVIAFDSATNDLVKDDGLYTAVLISLFTDARAREDDALPNDLHSEEFPDRRGWWGDNTSDRENDSVGSRLWLLERSKVTTDNLQKAKQYVREALQWMIDEGVAAKIEVETEAQGDVLAFSVDILRSSGETISYKFHDFWESSKYLAETTVTAEALPEVLQFLGVGHSYVKGTLSGLGVTDNSYRREMYYRFRTEYNKQYVFVGSFTGGDIPTPYHNGVAGEDSDGLNTLIDGYLDAAFPNPTSADCVLMGPIGFADCLNSVALATFKANIDSIINKIHVHSPLIKIFVVTDNDTPDFAFPPGQDLNDYADEVRNAYNDALALGYNVYLIDFNTQSPNIGPDNIHLDWLGYEQMGEYMTDQIAIALNIPAVADDTLLQSSFDAANGTKLQNYIDDINETGNVWQDANDRFDINNNLLRGVGAFAFDSFIDIDQVVFKGTIKMYQSINASTYFVLKVNAASTTYLYMFMNQATSTFYLYNQGGVYDSAPFVSSLNTWYTFKVNVRGNSIRITDENDVEIIHSYLDGVQNNFTRIGFSYFPPSVSYFNDLSIEKMLIA